MMPADRPVLQRVRATGRLSVKLSGDRTGLDRLYQEGAAKIRFPAPESDALEAILINTAGGLTGGDRVAWSIEAAAGTHLALTTQACEKIYRAGNGHAGVSVSLKAGMDARLAWLPQETILFDRSALVRKLDIDLEPGARALLLEATIFGRQAMGEHVSAATFHDRWRVCVDGRLVHAEDFRIGTDIAAQLARPAIAAGGQAVATVLMIADRAGDMLDPARAIIGDAGGASHWRVGTTGKLLARLVAEDGYALRARLVSLIRLLNGRAGLPKIWTS
ncbi:urease accessory protein UreD [Mesorhizobium sp. YIM 152430]|uniref:urease accessory protein UreD n=1 Tax=Mesorhizobium sp. YIM 152430 TaxID=3031761 RepID=UPI0023DA3E8A|nr:urease accessory protein UreD [Mesorhizobium sp. YIM 152430]MDF1600984.1 urease accessory protein UreD [Mesorhizobium sp. YIM 152430]